MDFIRKNIPKQLNRNGYIVSNSYTSSYVSANSSGSNIVAGNYLPAILNNGRYAVSVATDFYSASPLWQWFKQTATIDETTSAQTITNTSILKLEEDTLTLGEYEVLTTKYFYVDSSGRLHTPFSLVSDKEITAYSTGSGTSNTGTTGDATTSTVLVVDTLTSTSTTTALSANQGRVLKGLIDGIDAHSHDNKEALDTITATDIANWNTAVSNTHTHSNKSILDAITDTTFVNAIAINGWNLTYTKVTTTASLSIPYAKRAEYLIRATDGASYISLWEDNLNITGLGKNIYLGAQQYKNNNYKIYFVTNNSTEDTEGTVFWNMIDGTKLYTEVPHYINLKSGVNDTVAPIFVNSTTKCTNLNADLLDGLHSDSFIKTSGNQVLNGNLTVNGYIKASGEVSAYNTSTTTSSTSTINFADDVVVDGNVKCDSIEIADIVNISLSDNNPQIVLNANICENNIIDTYYNANIHFRGSIDATECGTAKFQHIQATNITNAKNALANVENANTIDEIKTILINLRNSL